MAAACTSGQVYIFHCHLDTSSQAVRLDPAALALSGWLGSERVLDLDFCNVDSGTEIAGLSSSLLLVCLLARGSLRLLDCADGRCVGSVAAAAVAVPAGDQKDSGSASAFRVLKNGRHAVLLGYHNGPQVIDLWSSSATVASLEMPGDAPLLRLAVPSQAWPKRICPSWAAAGGRRLACGIGGGSMRAAEALQDVAAHSADRLFLWRFQASSAQRDGRRAEPQAPIFTSKLERDEVPVALALQDDLLLLAMHSRLDAWSISEAGTALELRVDWAGVGGALIPSGLIGVALLPPMSPSRSLMWPHHGSVSFDAARAPRGRSPEIARKHWADEQHCQILVAWTKGGFMSIGAPNKDKSIIFMRQMSSQPTIPLMGPGCIWRCSGRVCCAFPGPGGDALHVCTGESTWIRAVNMQDLWRCSQNATAPSVVCTAALEQQGRTWFAVGLSGGQRGASVFVLAGVGADGSAPEPIRLPLPNDFGEPVCLTALGPKFLVSAGSTGLVCWWTLDWAIAGSVQPQYLAPVLLLARVWSPNPSTGSLVLESMLIAALDELGKCRLIDVEAGQVVCSFQSQSGSALWLDEPLRVTYDKLSRFVCVATPSRAFTWDASSGAFEGSIPVAAARESASESSSRRDGQEANAPRVTSSSSAGFRCPTLRNPSFGVDAVSWQSLLVTGDQAPSACAFSSGNVILDGPLWQLPVILVSPAALIARPIAVQSPARADADSGRRAGPQQDKAKSIGDQQAVTSQPPEGSTISTQEAGTLWPTGRSGHVLAAQFRAVGERSVDWRSEVPFSVGTIGVDDSLSFPLPRRRGAVRRSAPPGLRRHRSRREALDRSSSGDFAGLAEVSEELLRSLEGGGRHLELRLQRPLCKGCLQVTLTFMVRVLLAADAAQQAVQRGALPIMRRLLAEAPQEAMLGTLCAWAQALQGRGGIADMGAGGFASRVCGLISFAAIRDAATVLLALVACVQPGLLDCCAAHLRPAECPGPPPLVALVAEGLQQRALRREGGLRLQGIACELLSVGFAVWRPHLSAAATLASASGAFPGGGARPRAAPAPGGSAAAPPAPSAPRAPAVAPGGGAAPREASPEVVGGPDDQDLDWLAGQILALYQEPRLSQSSLALLMQVGAAEPLALLRVMGKAARRLDMGEKFCASALLVLVCFLRGSPARVVPMLPRFTEVILRCLEPSDPALRRQNLIAVTSALHEMVQTFPMVAFHQVTQKLAVGTMDGLVVVYDLRTATKWRILEGHTGTVAALALSADGSRLCSYGRDDHSVRIWSCSSGTILGGLLGNTGRCVKQHTLPELGAVGSLGGELPNSWRAVSVVWTEGGQLKLVRENGLVSQFRPE